MSEIFITRKGGGGGKASAPTLAVTSVGGTFVQLDVTNNDQTNQATIFLLANYDTNSATDFDLLAAQSGQVINVAADTTVSTVISGLDPATTHTISAQAAVIKKLPSNIVTTDPTDLLQTGLSAPTIGPITENNLTSTVVTVKNNDLDIPVIIRAVATTSTTVPTNYPFATASLGPDTSTSLTITGLSPETTYYIHARAFDGDIQSANVVFGPYTTPELPLYEFTSWTFTNAGQTGKTGPEIASVRSAYSSQSWAQNNSYLSMTIQGIQEWTVPATATYRITTAGACGSAYSSQALSGTGATLRADFSLVQSDIIMIAVGQNGTGNGGGGGGTFVVKKNSLSSYTPLIIAGGGGAQDGRYTNAADATTFYNANPSSTSGKPGGRDGLVVYNGGSNGNGGSDGGANGGAGGGYLTNGGSNPGTFGGYGFLQGGSAPTINSLVGGEPDADVGGFGGGGGTSDDQSAAGGGYSGGGGTVEDEHGGAGGSYVAPTATNRNNLTNNTSHGYVIITRL